MIFAMSHAQSYMGVKNRSHWFYVYDVANTKDCEQIYILPFVNFLTGMWHVEYACDGKHG